MKKTISVAVALLALAFTTQAQDLKESEVPSKVKEAFAKKYPEKKARWEKEGPDYEAEFEMDHVESSATFDQDGVFKELEQEIKISDLPKIITNYCAEKYSSHKIAETSKITLANGNIRYEAELRKGKEHIDLLFDATGNFISRGNVEVEHDEED
jgi:hypothetical protein